jgi:hypothetical protein
MGEVFKARDTRLDRTVAIKVLPADVADDADLRARFEREARAIAALDHPHICAIYDVGEADQVRFLVMQCLEGETLAARLTKGPLPLDQVCRYASEIADALDKAHRAGITHRDVKPANIMLTRTGATLLDFGLAKLRGAAAPISMSGMTRLATTPLGTAHGTILGTVPYMAPEQVEGREADARSDIWALGAVIYEMATGARPFRGETPASVIGAILKDEPAPLSALQPLSPPSLDHVVARCLAKDPDERWQSAGDVRRELTWAIAGGRAAPPLVPGATRRFGRLGWILAAALGVALVVTATIAVRHFSETAPVRDPVQFEISAPTISLFGGTAPQFAISPDGRQVAFVARRQSALVLWIEPLSTRVARPLAGTEGATHPFWSPDSRSIGFFADYKLKTVEAIGGSVTELCAAPTERGGAWNGDNVILFAPTNSGPLQRLTLGGTPTPATELAKGERSHRWPAFLPDGRHYLYFVGVGDNLTGEIRVGSLDSKTTARVIASDSNGLYTDGHVVFARGDDLMALPFSPDTRQSRADAFRAAEQVGIDNTAYAGFSASTTGVLTYAHGSRRQVGQLTWFDRAGKVLGTVGDPGEYFNISLSREERIAAALLTESPPGRDIWVIDPVRAGARSRLTIDPATDFLPIWSPDGSRVAFVSNRSGSQNIYLKAADDSGLEALARTSRTNNLVTDWSRDGQFLAYVDQTATGMDLWVLSMSGEKKASAFLQNPANENNPVFSPDGHWIAYDSDESGPPDVYVKPFPATATATGGRHTVSLGRGGTQPVWWGEGGRQELFFLALDGTLMSASVSTSTPKGFEADVPQIRFPTGNIYTGANVTGGNRRQYAVARDGKRFLVIVPKQDTTSHPITVVINWLAALEKKR